MSPTEAILLIKLCELTGNPLELYTPTYPSNRDKGAANYSDTVKEIEIGQSASKLLKQKKVQRLICRPQAIGGRSAQLLSFKDDDIVWAMVKAVEGQFSELPAT
jgi:hypothetical protein